MVYELDAWPKIPLNKFKLKNFLSGVANLIKKSDKGKWVSSGYGIACDRVGS